MKYLKQIREKLGLTQEEFAWKIGISRSFYALIENGKRGISPDIAIAIEQATDGEIKKEWLVFPSQYQKEIKAYIKGEHYAGVGK